MSTVEEFEAAQAVEYGTYVATAVITYNGARAYNPGDAVPVSNVELHGYVAAGLVRKVGDPAPEPPATVPAPQPMGDPVVIDPTEKG